MALSTSFNGGWYFLGQFFDSAVVGVDKIIGDRRRTREEELRWRARFHLDGTPAEIIASVAERLLDEEDDEQIVAELYAELQRRYIEWRPEYRQQIIAEHDRLVEERDERLEAEAQAQSEWLQRRQKSMRRH